MASLEALFLALGGVDNSARRESEAILQSQRESDPAGVRGPSPLGRLTGVARHGPTSPHRCLEPCLPAPPSHPCAAGRSPPAMFTPLQCGIRAHLCRGPATADVGTVVVCLAGSLPGAAGDRCADSRDDSPTSLHITFLPLPPPGAVKSTILEVFVTESVDHIRRKACHTTAELATTCYRMGQSWPELFVFIVAAARHEDPGVRAIVLVLLRRVLDYVGQVGCGMDVCA